MQTFIPYPDFRKSAECLDYKRLGNQRNEAKVIIEILEGKRPNSKWSNHPAVKMWEGHVEGLKVYFNCIVLAWMDRGYKNNMWLYNIDVERLEREGTPSWYGNEEFHASHRSNLLRKDYEFYSKYGWKEKDDLPYVWMI